MPKLNLEELPENIRNLERHFGYTQYRDLFKQQKISPGDSILTFKQIPNGQLYPYRYYAVSAEALKFTPDSQLTLKARNQLKSLDWFLDPR
jgi:hypothetical protein